MSINVEDTKKQIESYKKIIKGKKFTKGYRQSCQDAIDSLEAMLKAEGEINVHTETL